MNNYVLHKNKIRKNINPDNFLRNAKQEFSCQRLESFSGEYYNIENEILEFQFGTVCANQVRSNYSVGLEFKLCRKSFLKSFSQKFLGNHFLVSTFLRLFLFRGISQLFYLYCNKIFLICIWESKSFPKQLFSRTPLIGRHSI